MNTKITAKNIVITPAISNRITKKTEKMYKYLHQDTEIHVHIAAVSPKKRKVEVTVPLRGTILHAETFSDENLYIAIDSALSKIERQIHKYKDKLGDKVKQSSISIEDVEFIDSSFEEDEKMVAKRKTYPIRPMNLDDAMMHMEMLGHTFFVYVDAESGATNVLYSRKDGSLGLLEPEV